jgi:CheY-like chemotaxis protein
MCIVRFLVLAKFSIHHLFSRAPIRSRAAADLDRGKPIICTEWTWLVVYFKARLIAVYGCVCEVLRKNGYSVLCAANGREALRLVREDAEPIDLVITDMVMPQMGGRELAEALRELQPHTKILYMSGYAEGAEDVTELLSHGHAFIEKPFTPEALLHKIRDVLFSGE